MATSADGSFSEGKLTQRHRNGRSLYRRHKLKLLNLGLIAYLCFGAFLFDYLGDFYEEQPITTSAGVASGGQSDNNSSKQRKTSGSGSSSVSSSSRSLSELRLDSARRMWNITNQLNILYESNWTQLILDELAEFERQFIESLVLASGGRQQAEVVEDISSGQPRWQAGGSSELEHLAAKSKARSRSIRMSLIHSLATITTIGSSSPPPPTTLLGPSQSQAGKLATVLYGVIGIPLLIYTLTQTGKQLAHSTLNALLVLRHYCFALPIHYLCCACSPYLCFRWLGCFCCCCCCCCKQLCCSKENNSNRKAKCCDTQSAPKLRLVHSKRCLRRSRPCSATDSTPGAATLTQVPAYVISTNQRGNQQKSVRFMNQPLLNNHQTVPANDLSLTEQQQQQQQQWRNSTDSVNKEEQEEGEKSLYSFGLLMTSSSILLLYFSLGAYFYSRTQSVGPIDAIYVCYAMLSTSTMPDSFLSSETFINLVKLYETLKKDPTKSLAQMQSKPSAIGISGSGSRAIDNTSTESIVWFSLYLIGGLNLISMCFHFACHWLSSPSKATVRKTKGDFGYYSTKMLTSGDASLLNGHVLASSSFLGGQMRMLTDLQHQQLNEMVDVLSSEQITGEIEQQRYGPMLPGNAQQQQQQQMDLAELFVVSQQPPPAEVQFADLQQSSLPKSRQQQQLLQNSDVSFASDRSTDRLCMRHAAQVPPTSASASIPYCSSPSIYSQHLHAHSQQHGEQQQLGQLVHSHNQTQRHHHLSQSHLYLPTLFGQHEDGGNIVGACAQINAHDTSDEGREGEREGQEGEEGDDEVEAHERAMSRMLKSCLAVSGEGVFRDTNSNHFVAAQPTHHRNINSGLLTVASHLARESLPQSNHCEQDSLNTTTLDTTTNSNTMSSISSRTVKLPATAAVISSSATRLVPNGIVGFINLNDEAQHQ